MKKLEINHPGKTQFTIEDIVWMQNAYIESMYDIVRATGADNLKLHGCEVSASAITAGAVIINKEVCRVDAQSGNFDTGTWWLQKQTTYDSTGDRLFLDGTINGTQQQVFKIDKAIPVLSSSQPVDSIPIYAAYVFEHEHKASEIIESSFKQFSSQTEKNNWNSKANGSHTHNPSDINTDANNRFVTDGEKNIWNSKANGSHTHNPSDINTDVNNRFVTDAEKNDWNSKANGSHTHNPSAIVTNAYNRFVTDTEISDWNSKANGSHTHNLNDLNVASPFIVGDTGVAFGPDFIPSTANGAVSLRYYKQGRVVTIEGAFGTISEDNYVLVFQLPIGYRPPGNIVAKLFANEHSDPSFHISSIFSIHSDGQVLIDANLYSYGFDAGYILISFIV